MKEYKASLPVIRREGCPVCQDTGEDNVAVYTDGSKYCFGCNKSDKKIKKENLYDLNIQEIQKRKLNEQTCRFFNYQVAKYSGSIGNGKDRRQCQDEWVQVAEYRDNEVLVAQKIRTKDKEMTLLWTNKQELPLYGQNKWSPNKKLFITITEGEIDAMTIAQVQGYQYPVVSVPMGAAGALKSIQSNLDYLLGFRYIVLAFDNDDAGHKATEQVLSLLMPVAEVRVVEWPLKDANDMLLEGREKEITSILFNAKVREPKHSVTIKDIMEKILLQPQYGSPYPWKTLTEITYGFQLGEIHVIVAANGIGKTEYVKELIFHFLGQDIQVGLFSFEQNPEDTVRRLVGSKLNSKLHLPGSEWDEDAIRETAMGFNEKLWLFEKAGSADIDELFNTIKYWAIVKGVKLFFIDNLKGLKLQDKESAEGFMTRLQAICKDLRVTTVLLSHLSKDKYSYQAYVSTSPKRKAEYESMTAEEIQKLVKRPGMEWETGRMPTKENIEGFSVVADLAHYVFGLSRNTTSEDTKESTVLNVKVLKSRLDSKFAGKVFKLQYTFEGRLIEQGDYDNINVNPNIGGTEF